MLLLLFDSKLPLKVNPSYMYSGQKSFPQKRDTDRVTMTVDFKDVLSDGEEITSATWFVEKMGSPDINVKEMLYATPVVNGSMVLQMIEGGEPGNVYEPYCIALTSGFQKLSLPEPGKGLLKIA